jgi:hypothetical protein
MNVEQKSLSSKIARLEDALKAGLLEKYAPAKSQNATDTQVQRSWGPAMRI